MRKIQLTNMLFFLQRNHPLLKRNKKKSILQQLSNHYFSHRIFFPSVLMEKFSRRIFFRQFKWNDFPMGFFFNFQGPVNHSNYENIIFTY